MEARLIELAADGARVEAACMARLRREEAALSAQGRGRSASAAVMLLLRACLIGLRSRLPQLLGMLSTHLDEDAALASVVDCGHRLVTLWRARKPLGVQQHPQLQALLERVWLAALFLLPDLALCESGEAKAVRQLLSLRELGRLLAALGSEREAEGAAAAAPISSACASSWSASRWVPRWRPRCAAHRRHCSTSTATGTSMRSKPCCASASVPAPSRGRRCIFSTA